MHESCLAFGMRCLSREEIEGKSVLEVGSYDINGSYRPRIESFDPSEYTGIDLMSGPRVDLVLSAERIVEHFGENRFGVVLSTEVLEHVRNWKAVVSNIKRVCKPQGIILITTRSLGFPHHTAPFDFWRYQLSDIEHIFSDCKIQLLRKDPQVPGVFLKAWKPDPFSEMDLSDYEVYGPIDPIDEE